MIQLRKARPADAGRLVLRKEDLEEAALYGCSPEEGLKDSILRSQLALASEAPDGALLALFGLFTDHEAVHPWLMSSEAVQGHPRALLRLGRWLVEEAAGYGLPVWNHIGKQSHSNRRFVQHLGFLIEPLPNNPVFDRFYLPN